MSTLRALLSVALLASPALADPTGGDDPTPPTPTTPPTPPTLLPTDQPLTPAPTDQPPPITPTAPDGSLGVIIDYPRPTRPGAFSHAWREPGMTSKIGVGLTLGAGITGFTDGKMRDVIDSNVGGLWGVHASIGTHIPIGLDLSYVGSSASLKSLEGFDNGSLLGTTLEGAIRYNVLPHFSWNPYAFVGLGWQRYDVQDPRFATSDTGLSIRDDSLEVPMGVGIGYRRSGFVGDLRGTFRAVQNPSLLVESDGSEAALHTWEASASLGYEF